MRRHGTLLLMALAYSFTQPCLGQIGATKDELSHRYGPPSAYNPQLSSLVQWKEYHNVLDDICTFHPDNLDILVYFKLGKAVVLKFTKKNRSPLTEAEISSLRASVVAKPDWVLVPDGKSDPRWRKRDSSVFAYYFRYGNPTHEFMVQTASVDAIFQKTWLGNSRR
jgi:hypothetical protein